MKRRGNLFWNAGTIALFSLLAIGPVLAQSIAGDGTLTTTVTTPDNLNFTITNGSQVGTNLFHSFNQFSVPTGGSAFFNNAIGIENIIGRVTGRSLSSIDGLLRANGSANLFLINPNGIIFGSNASLDVGGSFLATTASAVRFSDGTQFTATASATPLLTVSVPVGLQYDRTASPIEVRGSNLTVRPGRTLSLLGSNLTLMGGNLNAPGGRIELGSVASPSLVNLNVTNSNLILGYQEIQNFEDIQLSQGASVDTSGIGGGSIHVQARSLFLSEGSRLVNLTAGTSPGGAIIINTSDSVELTGTGTYTNDILRFATGTIGPTDLRNGFFTLSFGAGAAGDIIINTPRLIAQNGAFVATATVASGRGGNLTLNADIIDLNASAAIAGTANDGDSGNLTINTRRLSLQNLALVTINSLSIGRIGSLSVNASELIELSSIDAIPVPGTTGLVTGLTSNSFAGSAGSIEVTTGRLVLNSGAIVSASTATGQGGNIRVRATEAVEVIGSTPNGRNVSSFAAVVEAGSSGQGGDLTIETGRLIVRDRGRLSVRSRGTGDAGNINIIADSIQLDDRATIAATSTVSGEGGNIRLTAPSLILRDNSSISAEAGTSRGIGNGGNLAISADTFVALGNSDIIANAFQGNGGNINIIARGIFRSLDSNITASSQLGINGVVSINTPDIDPSTGLVILSAETVDVEGLVASGCAGGERVAGRFVVTGRGGLPPNPEGTLSNDLVLADLRTVPIQSASTSSVTTPAIASTETIVEANGWTTSAEGKVVLISNPVGCTR